MMGPLGPPSFILQNKIGISCQIVQNLPFVECLSWIIYQYINKHYARSVLSPCLLPIHIAHVVEVRRGTTNGWNSPRN